jgi:hypothetical protein
MDVNICGFLVARLPKCNYDEQGRGAFPAIAPHLDDVYYGGMFRMPWFEIEEDYYAKTLNSRVAEMWQLLKTTNQDFSGFEMCRDIETAKCLLEYSNQKVPRNELIAVRSKALSNIKGEFNFDDARIDWFGFDIVSLGHWSLLRDGLFMAPSYFAKWTSYLNKNGVFEDSSVAQEYANDYNLAAEKRGVEELPPSVYGIDAIEIGRVE